MVTLMITNRAYGREALSVKAVCKKVKIMGRPSRNKRVMLRSESGP